MFWKSKKVDTADSKIILGMVMLTDSNSWQITNFINDFKNHYGDKIAKTTGDSTSFVFSVDGEKVAIAYMNFPIPAQDIEETAEYAYNWENALSDTQGHKAHLIVSLIQGGRDQIKRFRIFTRVVCSLLRTTNAIGIYQGNQSLLIPTNDYLHEAQAMSEEWLPLNLWIYFGLRVTANGNSGYTYGLKEFNKTEMEIVNSSKSVGDIREFLFNTAHYVLDNDVTFKDGQTIGGSEKEKIKIGFSQGKFINDKTYKFSF